MRWVSRGMRFTAQMGLLMLLWTFPVHAQYSPFSVHVQPIEFPNMPPLHSFAAAQFQGKWYLFGGRRDGLHRRQPFRAFDSAHANRYIWCVDPESRTIDSLSISLLAPSLQSQLASTNMLFHQEGDFLYLLGGYGLPCKTDLTLFAPPSKFTDPKAHRTFPYLTQVNLSLLQDAFLQQTALKSNKTQSIPRHFQPNPPASAFQQWTDPQFALTGGAMFFLNDPTLPESAFYLVGGHRFDGLYNPMGPDNGPGFEQEYHHGVRRFRLIRINVEKHKSRKNHKPHKSYKSHKKSNNRRKSAPIKTYVRWLEPLVDSQFRRRDVNVM
ncbi:MAG: hypothetical protein FJX91_08680, partial [Bacteroidetes bacterium]|nr:hypothetical protein [Bacteroidota bacterium]